MNETDDGNKVHKGPDAERDECADELGDAAGVIARALAAIFELTEDPIFVKDGRLRYQLINPAMEKLLGLRLAELSGETDETLLGPAAATQTRAAETRALAGELVCEVIDWPVGGSTTPFRVTWVPVRNQSGAIEGVAAVARDLAEQQKLQKILAQGERHELAAGLTGGLAHNFNNLLQVIMGGVELALSDLDSHALVDAKSNLVKVLDASRFGAETVRRLKEFSGLGRQIPGERGSVIDISQIAGQAVALTKPWWRTNLSDGGARITIHEEISPNCFVQGNESELFEVMVHLLRNAEEALGDAGRITVRSFAEGPNCVVKVEDAGVGVAPQYLDKVFEPSWTTKGEGRSGMGLATCRDIIVRHGGEIFLHSEAGKGAEVTVRLPRVEPRPAEKVPAPPKHIAAHLRILVIDDNEPMVEMLARSLEKHGHEVFKATSGREGIGIFKGRELDAVICDLDMPQVNGWQVAKAVKETCENKGVPKTRFVMFTGWGGQVDAGKLVVECGVDRVVEKPLNFRKLLEVVRELVSK